jgi:hypothetical protein
VELVAENILLRQARQRREREGSVRGQVSGRAGGSGVDAEICWGRERDKIRLLVPQPSCANYLCFADAAASAVAALPGFPTTDKQTPRAAAAARPAAPHWPCMLTGMCSLRFQSAGRGQTGKLIGCRPAMCVPAGHTASGWGCDSAVRRLCLTAAHNVVALGLQPLGQVTAAAGAAGWTVVCGAPPHLATAPDAGAPGSRRCRAHLAMKPPAPVMHIRSFFWGQ